MLSDQAPWGLSARGPHTPLLHRTAVPAEPKSDYAPSSVKVGEPIGFGL